MNGIYLAVSSAIQEGFDFEHFITVFGSVCGCITGFAAVWMLGKNAKAAALAPDIEQNKRITALETKVEEIDKNLDSDNKKINAIIDGNKITQQSLLAIMGHLIDGKDIDNLKKSKSVLEQYLINK